MLFPLGVAKERVEIFLAPEAKKNELRVKFAEKRIEDGQVFLTLLVKAKGSYASSYSSSSASTTATGTTATTTALTATTTATTTPAAVTEDATRRFNATIAYLEGIKADLLKNGDEFSASALQNAIDAMIAQAQEAPTVNGTSVLVKVKENANKFKMDVRIANSTTTTKIAVTHKNNEHGNGNDKKDKSDDNDDHASGTTTTVVKETFFSKIFHKEDKKEHDKKSDKKDKHEDEDDDEDEHEGFFDRFGKKATICHISDGHNKTISVGKSAVKAHLAHGDSLGKCGEDGTATTTPDTTAPVVSNIVSHPATSTASVDWDTNENASYKFWYGTTSPLVLSGTPDKTGGASTHQTATLTGLSSDTTYYYVIAATDASGNTSTSSQQSFKTAVIPDTTAPTISDLSAALITANSATVYWNTNESATGKVRYGTTTPLTNVLENTALSLTHSFALIGLTASTTYRYIVSSTDGAGNTATSSELALETL